MSRPTAGSISEIGTIGLDIGFKANPEYIKEREAVWD